MKNRKSIIEQLNSSTQTTINEKRVRAELQRIEGGDEVLIPYKRKEKKAVVVFLREELSKEERINYEKNNPGYKLSFSMRYPYFPVYLSIISSGVILLVAILLVILKLQTV